MIQSQTLFADLKIGDTFVTSPNSPTMLIKTGHEHYVQENDTLVILINPNTNTPVFKISRDIKMATHSEPEDKDLRCFALDKAIQAYAHESISPINMVEQAQVFYEFLLNGNSKT